MLSFRCQFKLIDRSDLFKIRLTFIIWKFQSRFLHSSFSFSSKSLRIHFLVAISVLLKNVPKENEVTIRTIHRSFEHCRQVHVIEDHEGRVICIVFARHVVIELWDIHAERREIQVISDHYLPATILNIRDDPLLPINCRRIMCCETGPSQKGPEPARTGHTYIFLSR
jgi:hypothetical protein